METSAIISLLHHSLPRLLREERVDEMAVQNLYAEHKGQAGVAHGHLQLDRAPVVKATALRSPAATSNGRYLSLFLA